MLTWLVSSKIPGTQLCFRRYTRDWEFIGEYSPFPQSQVVLFVFLFVCLVFCVFFCVFVLVFILYVCCFCLFGCLCFFLLFFFAFSFLILIKRILTFSIFNCKMYKVHWAYHKKNYIPHHEIPSIHWKGCGYTCDILKSVLRKQYRNIRPKSYSQENK